MSLEQSCPFSHNQADETYELISYGNNGELLVETLNVDDHGRLIIYENTSYEPDCEDCAMNDEDMFNYENKHWAILDTQLKEFACPKTRNNANKIKYKNECNVVQFPSDLHTTNSIYYKDPTFKIEKLGWNYFYPEQRIGKLLLEENYSRMLLRKLINSGLLRNIDNVISIGSESLILHANCNPSHPDANDIKRCVVKVYKTKLEKNMSYERVSSPNYKYHEIFTNDNTRQLVKQWANDEYNFLLKLEKIGINVPKPICVKAHCIVMSYIGDEKPPTLSSLNLSQRQWEQIYLLVIKAMNDLYIGGFVHGDLNEYNILWWQDQYFFIDFSHTVSVDNVHYAKQYLKDDCKRITKFFQPKLSYEISPQELYTRIWNNYF